MLRIPSEPDAGEPSLSRRALVTMAAVAVAGRGMGGSAGALASADDAATDPSSTSLRPADRLRVAVMGVNGRGAALARAFAADPRARIVTLCDVDSRVAGPLADSLGMDGETPRVERDIRRVLDDPSVDVLVVAAPNHWHAPATILGCLAGKHVYVEKPCSHTPEEGELAVAAARAHRRVVQMGSQRRSWPAIREGVEVVRSGGIGQVRLARTWYAARRGSIGRKALSQPPEWLDWTLWQGPAPERPFKENIVHYNWHWHWHWGDGELGNNGVHAIDVARWGLAVDYPTHVTAGGGRLHVDDDQETPDTMSVSYTFPGNRMITWEGLSCVPTGLDGTGFGVWFVGSEGSLVMGGGGAWKRLDAKGAVVEERSGEAGDRGHIANFLDCVVSGGVPHADIAEAHRSTLLCHLGNIAWRTGGSVATRPEDGHITDAAVSGEFWGRDYRDGWGIRAG